jgi:hypothetical protein
MRMADALAEDPNSVWNSGGFGSPYSAELHCDAASTSDANRRGRTSPQALLATLDDDIGLPVVHCR